LFGIFQTSVFWTVLADLFSSSQARRLFGLIATGGTAGAIAGSFLTSQLANRLSTDMLLLLPAFTIELGLFFAWRLERCAGTIRKQKSESGDQEASVTGQPTEGGLLSGITHVMHSPYLAMICLFLFFVQMFGTQLYFEQAEIVRASIDQDQLEKRIQLFADIDFYANLLTLLVQSLVAGVILRRFGVSLALVILPIVYSLGFIALALTPTLAVLVVVMVAARTAAYGITVPTREVLFTVVSREDKYKSKNFIDTVVYRGGDALSAKVMGTLTGRMGLGFQSLNLFALPLIAIWGAAAWQLGRRQKKLAEMQRRNS
jgi:AAA family ATP:ADP antiporter